MAHAGGRPTKATPENISRAWGYVNQEWIDLGEAIPTVEGLAAVLQIHKDTLYERDEFSDVLGRLKNLQGSMLITGGLKGSFNPTIAKLLLSSKHDYVEKSATDLTTKGKELPTPILGGMSVSDLSGDNSDEEASTS